MKYITTLIYLVFGPLLVNLKDHVGYQYQSHVGHVKGTPHLIYYCSGPRFINCLVSMMRTLGRDFSDVCFAAVILPSIFGKWASCARGPALPAALLGSRRAHAAGVEPGRHVHQNFGILPQSQEKQFFF